MRGDGDVVISLARRLLPMVALLALILAAQPAGSAGKAGMAAYGAHSSLARALPREREVLG
jgi:hypothetical protein